MGMLSGAWYATLVEPLPCSKAAKMLHGKGRFPKKVSVGCAEARADRDP